MLKKIKKPLCWYLLWFLLITSAYWLGLIVFPKRDHPVFMLNRLLFDSDLEWFLKTLNYARTRLLLPGDSFAFRPVHMFIIGLEDLLFRYNLLAQGIISSAIFSATATALFFLSKKISHSIFLSIGVTSLWAFQLAGAEILLWQHITPYILLPGFFCIAILLIIEPHAGKTTQIISGTLVFLAGVTHEIGGLIALSLALAMLVSGADNRKQYVRVFALGGIAALSLSAFDYFIIHQIKSFTGSADSVTSATFFSMISSLLPFTGAIGVAAFAPSSVQVYQVENWFIGWNFVNISKPMMTFGVVSVSAIIVITLIQTIKSMRESKAIALNITSVFALSLFGLSYGVAASRILTRSVTYMTIAPYYFSLLSLAVSTMILVMTVRINKRWITGIVSTVLCVMSVWHVTSLYGELKATRNEKAHAYNAIQQSREKISNDDSVCFGGINIFSAATNYKAWDPLYQDISCSRRIGAQPLYLSYYIGNPALVDMQITEPLTPYENITFRLVSMPKGPSSGTGSGHAVADVPFGHSFEITLDKIISPVFLLTTQTGTQLGFSLSYNMIYAVNNTVNNGQEQLINSMLWNPGKFRTTYKFLFAGNNKIVLLANGLFIGLIHSGSIDPSMPVRLEIFSKHNDSITISKAIIATSPGTAFVNFTPRHVF